MTRLGLLCAAVGVTLGALAFAGAPARGALPPPYGGQITLPAPRPLGLPDPTDLDGPFDEAVSAAVFDTLYGIEPDGGVVPLLARGLPEVQGTTVTLAVREDVRRHDGRMLTAESVVSSLRHAARQPEAGWLLAWVAGAAGNPRIDAVDEHRLRLRLRDGHLWSDPETLARMLAAQPLAVVANAGRATGTGPFRVRMDGGRMRLTQFRQAVTGAPRLSEIQWHPPKPREQELRAFELGRIDGSWHGKSLYGGEPVRPATSIQWPEGDPVLLVRNDDRGPLRDDALWGALARRIDRERLERVGLAATAELTGELGAPDLPPAQALQGRERLTMPVLDGHLFARQLAEALAGVLDDAGFTLVVQSLSPRRMRTALARGQWDLRVETVCPPLSGNGPVVGASLAASGQSSRARALVSEGRLFDASAVRRALSALDSLVLGHRREELFYRADLGDVGFGPLGRWQLAPMHLSRGKGGRLP
jgi:MarR-like DNA-binding transcriptional regulator SgrR of sgrS sRNA